MMLQQRQQSAKPVEALEPVIVCAWCQYLVDEGRPTSKSVEDSGIDPFTISHTICQPCSQQYFP